MFSCNKRAFPHRYDGLSPSNGDFYACIRPLAGEKTRRGAGRVSRSKVHKASGRSTFAPRLPYLHLSDGSRTHVPTASETCPVARNPTEKRFTMPENHDPNHEHQLVFTSSQAARYLGVSLATVRRWTDAGYLTGYRTPGGQRRFSREQLDGFIDSLQRTG